MVIETVRFLLNDGVSKAAFQQAVEQSTGYLRTCQGFINRVTGFGDEGECIDLVLWETRADGERVWQIFDAAPENRAVSATIAETTSGVAYFDLVHEGRE